MLPPTSTSMIAVLLALASCWAPPSADGARILAVFAMKGRSHTMVNEPLVRGLAARGHAVDVYGHYIPDDAAKSNVTYHALSKAGSLAPGLDIALFANSWLTRVLNPVKLLQRGQEDCAALFSDPAILDLIRSDKKYDLFITELFNTDCYLGLGHRFQVPVVALSTCPILPWANARFGNPDNPSHVPSMHSGWTDVMSLPERLVNAAIVYYSVVSQRLIYEPLDQRWVDQAFGPGVPAVRDMALNTSLLFTNTFHGLTLPRPLATNVVEIGGIHIDAFKPLPQDLEQFVSGAKDGVILFSLGSMIRASSLPKESAAALLRGFGALKQRVVWKWEDEAPGPVPDNVRLSKWLPQFDVICHNNTRLFIGHGGLLSTTEAAICGVPLLGVPVFGDQHTNVAAVAKAGAGRSLPVGTLKDADLFLKNVKELLEDPSYKKNASALSKRFRDRPMSPLDTAVYWTEYVIRHKGAPHLRGGARNLAWYQEALLDVFAVVFLLLAAALLVLWKVLRAVLRLVRRVGCPLVGACDQKKDKSGGKKKKQ